MRPPGMAIRIWGIKANYAQWRAPELKKSINSRYALYIYKEVETKLINTFSISHARLLLAVRGGVAAFGGVDGVPYSIRALHRGRGGAAAFRHLSAEIDLATRRTPAEYNPSDRRCAAGREAFPDEPMRRGRRRRAG